MTAHDIQCFMTLLPGLRSMTFGEVFPDDAIKCMSRFGSVPYDTQRAVTPTLAPSSPCYIKEPFFLPAFNIPSLANKVTLSTSTTSMRKFSAQATMDQDGSIWECLNRATGRAGTKSSPFARTNRKSNQAVLLVKSHC